MLNKSNRVVRLQIENYQRSINLSTRDSWDSFLGHRTRIMDLLRSTGSSGTPTLCVLGAGNCNDLDLSSLCELYCKVDLIDLDAVALKAGIAGQVVKSNNIQLRGGVDTTGVARLLSQLTPDELASQHQLDHCLSQLSVVPELADRRFDVVLSACLLTQLIGGIIHTLGETHPRFLEMVMAVRLQHLRQLLGLTSPGGTAILVTDIVSSDSCPMLTHTREADLPQFVSRAINARNFFTGVNPVVITELFRREPILDSLVANVKLIEPWLWDLGSRSYAVYAVVVTRAA